MENTELIVGNGRPIPFNVRKQVREQISQMLEDNIIQPSTSSYLNSLTIVMRENKKPRLFIDARKVNTFMKPDNTRVQPIQQLLQQFHGSKYISAIDISSAFLQVELEPSSRKYTAFLFESQVYQFTRTPYGFKNSLSAFVRALGTDTQEFVLSYVDDLTLTRFLNTPHPFKNSDREAYHCWIYHKRGEM
jgi:hypothetical protein